MDFRFASSFRFACIAGLFAATVAFAEGPADRVVTDPKSVNSTANAEARAVPISDLLFAHRTVTPAWSADGKSIVFSTDFTGRLNLWKIPAQGGWPVQMTQSEELQIGALYSPDGKWIVFQADKGGNEQYDIYSIPAAGGATENLTNTPEISEEPVEFSRDGNSLLITYKPKTASSADVAIMDWHSRKVRNLTQESSADHLWQRGFFSPDGREIFATRVEASFQDASVWKIDVATGAKTELTPHTGKDRTFVDDISPDGKTLLVGADEDGQPNVAQIDLATGKKTFVTHTGWEAQAGQFSPDGKLFTYTLNSDGQSTVYVVERASGKQRAVQFSAGGSTDIAQGARAFSPDGRRLLLTHTDSRHPRDLWTVDPNAGDARPMQLTFSSLASVSAEVLPAAQLVHYKSFDGKIISAYLWMPYNLQRDGRAPAVVLPHGGPTGQTTDVFNSSAAALASRGYICIAPNVRGSTGYGMEFQKANYEDLGGGDLKDEVAAVDFLVQTGFANARKVGIFGGSYGGYMTLMAVGKTPDVWAAGVSEYGIINWLTMLKGEDPSLVQYEESLLGDPVKDRAIYENASPLKYMRQAKAPLLVLQGENDPRVPKEQAAEVVAEMKAAGRTVEVHYYPAEGHGFNKRENRVDALERAIAWFDKYLQ